MTDSDIPGNPLPGSMRGSIVTDPVNVIAPDNTPEQTPPGEGVDQVIEDAKQAVAIASMREDIAILQTQILKLGDTNQQQQQNIAYLHEAMLYMPCPHGKYINLPAEGWSGRPEDAPGASPATVEDCLQRGMCDCETGLYLSRLSEQTAPA